MDRFGGRRVARLKLCWVVAWAATVGGGARGRGLAVARAVRTPCTSFHSEVRKHLQLQVINLKLTVWACCGFFQRARSRGARLQTWLAFGGLSLKLWGGFSTSPPTLYAY